MKNRKPWNQPQNEPADHQQNRVSDLQPASQNRTPRDPEQNPKNQLNRPDHPAIVKKTQQKAKL